MNGRTLYLCAGTQSSGSTLISWCFLQRHDMDGVLDARFDHLPSVPEKLSAPLPWVKFTIACFRFSEVMSHFEDEGCSVKPLLVVRDVRSVFNSLIQKKYGRNGITADDPPIRLRLRRFLEDWRLFRDHGWPMLRYEDFTQDPVKLLQKACARMRLRWDDAMARGPRSWSRSPIRDSAMRRSCSPAAARYRRRSSPRWRTIKTEHTPPEDLEWMEREFAEMNAAMGYPVTFPRRPITRWAIARCHDLRTCADMNGCAESIVFRDFS